MKLKRRDPVKLAIWAVIVLGLVWALVFVPNGPQFVLNGIRFGSILMLGAIGLTLTYRILNFANFSHGDILIFGAYIALSVDWWLVGALPGLFERLPQWLPWLPEGLKAGLLGLAQPQAKDTIRWIAIVIAMLAGAVGAILLAIGIDRVLYRRLRRSAAVTLVIASFGMALFIRALVQAIWGVGNRAYAMRITPPTVYAFGDIDRDGRFDVFVGSIGELIQVAGTRDLTHVVTLKMTTIQWVTLIVSLALVTLLHLFLKYTKTGKAMRAIADNMDLARVSGINTERMIKWVWAIGAGLAAIAGVFIGLNWGIITPNTGALVLLSLFAAVILGGIGSPYGAMLGALVIGIAQNVLVAPVTSVNSQYKPAIAFLLMIAMLLIRPQGLLGEAGRRG